jgi:hypothetical protein
VQAARAGLIDFRDINLEPDALATAQASTMCAGAFTQSTPRAVFLLGLIARLRFGLQRQAKPGSGGCLACRFFVKSPALHMIGSPPRCSPGIAGWVIGRAAPACSPKLRADLHPSQ